MAGFASPDRLRPQVFSTSRRLHPPRACRPCFMPDPLMGLCPSEPSSSRAAVRRLRRRSPLAVGPTFRNRTLRAPSAAEAASVTQDRSQLSSRRNGFRAADLPATEATIQSEDQPRRGLPPKRPAQSAVRSASPDIHKHLGYPPNDDPALQERPRLQGFAPHESPPLDHRWFRPATGA
jgi:hypothetical protein